MSSVYETLSKINVSDKIEKKGNLSYLSWAWAWSTLKANYPLSTYKVYENENGMNYHNDSMTAWVKVGVTVEDIEHIEYLPIMDFKNKSILLSNITSMDVNKAIQRALTKAIGRHGLGLYIYAGEDMPSETDGTPIKLYKTASKQTPQDKKEYWVEFSEMCKSLDIDAVEFLTEWAEIDMEDKLKVGNTVSQYLRDKDMFTEQLIGYKDNLSQR